jgi:formylglycine-generating enzyme
MIIAKRIENHKYSCMKSLIIAMFVGLMMVGCGELDLSDPETLDEILADAIEETVLQVRGKRGEELAYAPNVQTPYTGWVKEMWGNGQVKNLKQLKDGKNHGLFTACYDNGQKMEEVSYKNGKRDGLGISWSRDGQKEKEANYRDGEELDEILAAAFAKLGDRFTISDLGLEMLWVKHGAFIMGSSKGEAKRDEDEIHHQVTLTKGFYLGKYEVTQAQWERVMGNNPSIFKGADRPVEKVSWNDAVEFCKKLTEIETKAGRVPQGMSYQLPTEAQWEYACRAGTTTKYSWGDDINPKLANYTDSGLKKTMAVGSYRPNPWGFYDMHGNVWEWCADWFGEYPTSSVTDPIGVASGSIRVSRGGSWDYVGPYLRSAKRNYSPPSYRSYVIGFRVGFQSSK